MKHSIMFMDESVNLIESFKWMFRDEPYHLFVFDNPDDALDVVELVEFAVVVADQTMPGMCGIDFLKEVNKRSSNTIGIITTVFMGFVAEYNSMNLNYVYRFVKKPWDSIELKEIVKRAIANYEANREASRQASLV